VLLAVVAAAGAMGLRRSRTAIEQLRAAGLNSRVEHEQLERRVSREQSARESFALEVGRLRGRVTPLNAEPTLTLSPLTVRGSTPPEPTVSASAAAQSIQLRLLLPGGRTQPSARFAVSIRAWSSGRAIWSRGDLPPSSVDGKPAILARVTGDVLAPGAYEIGVSDVTSGAQGRDVAFYEVAVSSLESQ
jgi:hypothetical protein